MLYRLPEVGDILPVSSSSVVCNLRHESGRDRAEHVREPTVRTRPQSSNLARQCDQIKLGLTPEVRGCLIEPTGPRLRSQVLGPAAVRFQSIHYLIII